LGRRSGSISLNAGNHWLSGNRNLQVNVLFFPYWTENPYQPNLAAALKKKGVNVTGVRNTFLRCLIYPARGQDILHLHWSHPYLVRPGILKSIAKAFLFFLFLTQQKASGKKLIWTVHNLGEHERYQPGFERFCCRILARFADGIIVHSRCARRKTIEAYKLFGQANKLRVIPHGNYLGNYPNDISREQARARLGIGVDKKVFLFLGQIRAYKGLPELISAFTKISSGDEVLVLAGKPLPEQMRNDIKELTAGRKDIIFAPGFVPDEEIQVYMNAADAVVFPFRDIFTSGSILLAMSYAKAIIVPDLESLEEVKKAGGAITYDPQDRNGLEGALAAALSADLQKLGRLNLQEAEKLSWKSIAEKTAGLYTEVCMSGADN
jgi:beta-1,4-mannosyltransferase